LQRRKLSLWCFNPSFAFKSLLEEKPHSVLFASGTLAPLSTYAAELETTFPVQLENDHVIGKNSNQVMVGILTTDIEEQKLSFTFGNREEDQFYITFANTLERIFTKVPKGGILVFVPSYGVLKKIQKVWMANRLFKKLAREGGGEIFIEYQE
jgi:regulator of telomere elongation helicase 1